MESVHGLIMSIYHFNVGLPPALCFINGLGVGFANFLRHYVLSMVSVNLTVPWVIFEQYIRSMG